MLALIDRGLRDLSVSRTRERARGWGIPVPDDPGQVVYVWWDALGNYLTSLGLGTGGEAYRRWWVGGDRRVVHLVGKGVLRFHAVYWPAMLLSAGLPLPTDIVVHDYLTIDGQKISKSVGGGADPVALVGRFGTDPVRWWLLRDVPRVGDVNFTVDRLVARANADLPGGVGNLAHRVVTMVHRYRDGRVPERPATGAVARACREAPEQVAAALAGYDFRRACVGVWAIVDQSNRFLEHARPWELAAAERAGDRGAGDRLDAVLATLVAAVRSLARELAPSLPDTAAALAAQTTGGAGGRLPASRPRFARLVA